MASQEQPLDELIWRNQDWAMHFGGIHENTVLYYFAKSPFFDPTSNNATVEAQAMYNQDMGDILGTREAFESHLEKLNGLEYRVHLGPREFGGERPIGEGLWVIRKQNRRIIYDDHGSAESKAQVTVLETYFVMGESIYMAPSVSSIISSRLLSTTLAMEQLLGKAASFAMFSPSLGHHYLPPATRPKPATSLASQMGDLGREATPAFDTASLAAAVSKTNQAKTTDLFTLIDAYRQFESYGNEYMDENPIVGEPGAFQLSYSRQQAHAQSQQKEAAAKRAQEEAELRKVLAASQRVSSRAPSSMPETPKPKAGPVLSKKAGKGPDARQKPKRRKSKPPGTPMASTPKSGTPRGGTPKGSTPKGSTPKSATSKAATPVASPS